MPHYNIDPNDVADMMEGEVPEGFVPNFYESAEARVDFDQTGDACRRVRDWLIAGGFGTVTCTYDGGHDEGFAHVESATGTVGRCDADELAGRLKPGDGLVTRSPWGMERATPQIRAEHEADWAEKNARRRLDEVLEVLAEELAVKLLGKGFGTGAYEMRGRFRADLLTGEITDLEADPPAQKDF